MSASLWICCLDSVTLGQKRSYSEQIFPMLFELGAFGLLATLLFQVSARIGVLAGMGVGLAMAAFGIAYQGLSQSHHLAALHGASLLVASTAAWTLCRSSRAPVWIAGPAAALMALAGASKGYALWLNIGKTLSFHVAFVVVLGCLLMTVITMAMLCIVVPPTECKESRWISLGLIGLAAGYFCGAAFGAT